MPPKRYPIGKQDFQKLIDGKYIYVDKTRYVFDLAHNDATYIFLSRPRRFGKSLLLDTLKTYFSGKREYFKGLEIDELEKDWISYPVLHLDLSRMNTDTAEDFKRSVSAVLDQFYVTHGLESISESISIKLSFLVERLAEKYQKDVVLLVDEYDYPILSVLSKDEVLNDMRQAMRELFRPLKSLEHHLRFVFITGITKFSQMSLFSELNNIYNISMDPEYAGICGITEEELHATLDEDICALADTLHLSKDEALAKIKDMYDGYHFCLPSPDIYNPVSVIMSLKNRRLGTWWYETGTSASLIEVLLKSPLDISELLEARIEARAIDFDSPTESKVSPIAFLYQSGYLTIKDANPQTGDYVLAIPNKEVGTGLIEQLLLYYMGDNIFSTRSCIASLCRALNAHDIDLALQHLRSYLASLPYDLAAKDKKQLQSQMYILWNSLGYGIQSEVKTSHGRIDIVLTLGKCVYILELKYGKSSAAALEQIKEMDYALPFEHVCDHITLVGINFNPYTRTIDEDWQIEELT